MEENVTLVQDTIAQVQDTLAQVVDTVQTVAVEATHAAAEAGFQMPAWMMIPFGIMLLMIAIGPLVAEHWWEKNSHKLFVSLLLAVPVAIYMLVNGMVHELEHTIFGDYIPFIILLLTLFVITGGIHVSGDIKAKPWINTSFLGLGWILASIMGTTGAAMLLIRPLITTNQQRKHKVHTILFFIALVANCGGVLTPLGDPPLFMLFLRGAAFTWFLTLWKQWLFTGVVLMLIYFIVDCYFYKKEHWTALSADSREQTKMQIGGSVNFIYLLGVIATVAFVNESFIPAMRTVVDEITHEVLYTPPFWLAHLRDIILLLLMFLSLYTTKHKVRYELNKYTWAPIIEVAYLFLGIFITMAPALTYLGQLASAGKLPITETWHFYYATGALSSFLDNTPTAVAFHSMAQNLSPEILTTNFGNWMPGVAGIPEILLVAISLAAVFFGSMTYIGNGPNFMVKAIAEEGGIKMPSFFGYIFKFSLVVLLPVYILVQLIFL